MPDRGLLHQWHRFYSQPIVAPIPRDALGTGLEARVSTIPFSLFHLLAFKGFSQYSEYIPYPEGTKIGESLLFTELREYP
jgi:hypothetical protein